MNNQSGTRPLEAHHISVSIERPPAQVYAFAVNLSNLPRWASGLAAVKSVRFVEENSLGVLDHEVTLDSGQTVHNPMRVVPNEGGSELTFTLLRRREGSPEEFAADVATIQQDLSKLKQLVETQPEVTDADSAQHPHQAIDYIELTVSDLSAATNFYASAFGWRFKHYGSDYAAILGNGREVGGLRLDTRVTAGSPLVLLYSRDLEATLGAVKAAGGRIVKEPFAFPGGRRFHFGDTSGNELGVWSHS
jgi:predicted enzyme related to lactoylglutathione lyase